MQRFYRLLYTSTFPPYVKRDSCQHCMPVRNANNDDNIDKSRVRRERWKFNAWKFLIPLSADFVKTRNGKTLRMTQSRSIDLRHRVRSRDRPDCQTTFVVASREAAREKMGAASRHSSSKSSDGIVPSRRTSITPLSRGAQFTGRDSPALLRCLSPQQRPPFAISAYAVIRSGTAGHYFFCLSSPVMSRCAKVTA